MGGGTEAEREKILRSLRSFAAECVHGFSTGFEPSCLSPKGRRKARRFAGDQFCVRGMPRLPRAGRRGKGKA